MKKTTFKGLWRVVPVLIMCVLGWLSLYYLISGKLIYCSVLLAVNIVLSRVMTWTLKCKMAKKE